MERTCEQCSTDYEGGHNARFCPECRILRRRARQATPLAEQACEHCHKTYQPYRSGQRYCEECSRLNRNGHLTDNIQAQQRDEQMQKLFRYYKAKESVVVPDRPNGTRVISLSDTQFPFVDQPLLDTVIEFVSDWKPNDIILNGDILDAYEISDFDKRPERLFNLEDEMELARDLLRHLRRHAAKDARIYWVDGNHEERLQRTIWRKAQDFSYLVKDLPEAMELDQFCEAYVPYGKHVDYLGFVFTHGNFVSAQSAYTAKRHLDRYGSSGCNGHTHRLGSHSATDMHERSHTWFEQGCLCRRDLDYVRGVANWQHGFLTGVVMDGALHPQLVHVIETAEGRSFFAGNKHYRVRDV